MYLAIYSIYIRVACTYYHKYSGYPYIFSFISIGKVQR